MKDLNKLFAPIGLRVPEILLPARDIERFAVIACDQHTAEPEYWEETERIVGDAPSALHLMLPEAWLGRENAGADVPANMRRYLADGTTRPRRTVCTPPHRADIHIRLTSSSR